MPNDLVDYLTEIVQPLFDEKRVVVWYDREGALEQPLRIAAEQYGWRLIPGPGAKSPLAARAEIEEQLLADGLQWLAERKWLVYLAAERNDPSWYEDLELAGRKVQKTLAEVIAESHDLPTPKVAALVHADGARRLVEKWDQVFPSGTWVLDLDKLAAAMLSLAFGEPGQLSPQSAVHRLLREPVRLTEVLRVEGLTSTFNHVIRTQLGFGRLPESDAVRPELLVRAMMASELVHKGACDPSPGLHNFLPQKNHIATWAKMAETAAKDLEARPSFIQLARDVEAEIHLVEHATNLKELATVASVPSVDARLLDEAVARSRAAAGASQTATWNELRDRAIERSKLASAGVPIADDWAVVSAATQLLLGCVAAEQTLATLSQPSPDELIRRYADRTNGWWQLDDLHRGLEIRFGDCRSDMVEHLGKPAVAAAWKWSRRLTSAFADAFARARQYLAATPDVIPQQRFWSELVESGDLAETAVLFVDALRIDLAENLLRQLEQLGRQVTTRLALASLPSKTPVGMAALLPRGGSELVVMGRNGKLRVEIDGLDVSNPDGRIEQLNQMVPNIQAGQLKEITEAQLSSLASARRPVVLMTRDIDNSGEIAADVATNLFEDLVGDLARWVTVLHRVGYRRVVIGTDHGFLIVPSDASFDPVRGPANSANITCSMRYAVGPIDANEDCVAFAPTEMGRAGDARVVLPRGLAVFGAHRRKFVHGGLSPQECVLRFVVSTVSGPTRTPVTLRLSPVANITSQIVYLTVEVTTPSGPAQSRRARIEARGGDQPMGTSEVYVYKPETELRPGEIHDRIKVVITGTSPSFDFFLIDADSGALLDSQLGVPNVMRREAEEDLL